uniref:R3H domain-containing protein n=2 Tax=Plectus sambesii TaxID=2011161 RepID=A0A914WV55_9BILA
MIIYTMIIFNIGNTYLISCPGVLEFSEQAGYCVLPALSNCNKPPPTTSTTIRTTTTPTTTTPIPTTTSASVGKRFKCPSDGFHANPESCTSFYRCVASRRPDTVALVRPLLGGRWRCGPRGCLPVCAGDFFFSSSALSPFFPLVFFESLLRSIVLAAEVRIGEDRLAFCVDNRYLSAADADFVQCALSDVDRFASNQGTSRVLLFPPVSSYHRYLLHNTIAEQYPLLCTISIGEGNERRTVVYFGEHLRTSARNGELLLTTGIKRARLNDSEDEAEHKTMTTTSDTRARPLAEKKSTRKPDMAMYVPKAKRQPADCAPDDHMGSLDHDHDLREARKSSDTSLDSFLIPTLDSFPMLALDNDASTSKFGDEDVVADMKQQSPPLIMFDAIPSPPSSDNASEQAVKKLSGGQPQPTKLPSQIIREMMLKAGLVADAKMDTVAAAAAAAESASSAPLPPSPPIVNSAPLSFDVSASASSSHTVPSDHFLPGVKPVSSSFLAPPNVVDHGESILDCLPTSYDEFETTELHLRLERQISSPLTSPTGVVSPQVGGLGSAKGSGSNLMSSSPPPDAEDMEVAMINESFEEQQKQTQLYDSADLKYLFYSRPNANQSTTVKSTAGSDHSGSSSVFDQSPGLAHLVPTTTAVGAILPDASLQLSKPAIAWAGWGKKSHPPTPPDTPKAADFVDPIVAFSLTPTADALSYPSSCPQIGNNLSALMDNHLSSLLDSNLSSLLDSNQSSFLDNEQSSLIANNQSSLLVNNQPSLPCNSLSSPLDNATTTAEMLAVDMAEKLLEDDEEDEETDVAQSYNSSPSSELFVANSDNEATHSGKVDGELRSTAGGDSLTSPSAECFHNHSDNDNDRDNECVADDWSTRANDLSSHDSEPNALGSFVADDNTADSWEQLCDDETGELDPKVIQEINWALGKVKVEQPTFDYLSFKQKPVEFDQDELAHVLEIYGFPKATKTDDLRAALTDLNCRHFDVKWVDDNHALAVFSSADAAFELRVGSHHLIKLRPLSAATPQSQQKAKQSAEFLQPFKPRPPTNALLARRMVESALGKRSSASTEQRSSEKKQLVDAKERKQRLAALWEGNV